MENLQTLFNQFFKNELSTSLKNSSFTQSTYILLNKNLLNIVNNIISECVNIVNGNKNDFITSRQLLSAYLITYFQADVLSSQLSEKEQFIFNKSKELVLYIDTLKIEEESIICLIKKLNTYKYIFKNWLKNDADSQINIYCDIYHDYNCKIKELSNKKDPSLDVYIQELNKLKDTTKKYIEKLIGKDKVEDTIANYVYIEKTYDENVESMVKVYLKKAFWVDFKNRLLLQEPDYTVFNTIFNDIRSYTLNTAIYQDIDEIITHIEIKINNGNLEHSTIIEYIKQLIDNIQRIDSNPNYEIIYNKFNEISNNKQFVDIVVYSMTLILNQLENI